ncbi:hypothetical protein L581_3679 [Serratia fonticola AU-AP2C]|nr:hypothetical protein L581_3679 [Serratia fonticola AU-AP2C]
MKTSLQTKQIDISYLLVHVFQFIQSVEEFIAANGSLEVSELH